MPRIFWNWANAALSIGDAPTHLLNQNRLARSQLGRLMVPLNLEHGQLIVLTELLRRYRDTNHLSVEHDAETIALWDLCGQFEAMADKRPNAEEIE